jgi:carbon monoxide dehydrogenase subunit G
VIERTVLVDAPVEAVFDYLDDPMHVPDYGPGVDRVEVVRRTDDRVGDSFRTVYSVVGIDLPVTFVASAYERPRVLASRMEGAMSGEFRWDFRERETGGTEVGVRIDYQLKGGPVGRAFDALVFERTNEKNAERMLENLKRRVESVATTGV